MKYEIKTLLGELEGNQKVGFEFAKGVLFLIFYLYIATYILLFVYNGFIKNIDETDLTRWKRSGVKLRIDYGTGVQYLESRTGYLTPRLNADGSVMIIRKK